ncbi:MAG: PadR family transcriptional regulator [Methanobrevibacter sp.]|jgi:DNA-binding PadR family transcriptional regulator|uniref:PadR family transcriptional regulator n=1 Tax=Methanobrevibacter sp. TaxID=66852 RepID=UPI0025F1D703|nr:PadR family transcriptional regulator [Methanobrevibacter sp.]MBE6498205.1 PadR family transcriptional regulator [Methanobrevibacter sp.]
MTDENKVNETPKKLIKHFSNGITHNLILWIISKEKIHGYGIMKKLEVFFSFDGDVECDMNISSSKVYPILSKMEKKGLIIGDWDINENNKRVKYYSITEDGIVVLKNIQNHMERVMSNPHWINFFKDMTGMEINNEKCDRD